METGEAQVALPDASRVVLPPAEEAGSAETHPDVSMSSTGSMLIDDVNMDLDRPVLAVSQPEKHKSKPAPAKHVGGRRMKMAKGITVDSGAADPVMPRRMVRGRGNKIRPSAASKAGVHYVSASANRIPNEGEADMKFETEDGQALNWTFQIAEVNKVLASVSHLVDNKHRVVFDQDEHGRDISFITNKTTGQSIKMRRERNVWVIDAYIVEDAESGFARPEQTR